jgi:hypothetical protein
VSAGEGLNDLARGLGYEGRRISPSVDEVCGQVSAIHLDKPHVHMDGDAIDYAEN